MKSMCPGALLFRRKARRDVVAALDWCQVPCEAKNVLPMAVRMEQVANQRHIPGNQRGLESFEPAIGITPGLLRSLKLKEGLIAIVHLAPLRTTSHPEGRRFSKYGQAIQSVSMQTPNTGLRGDPDATSL